MLVTDEKEGRKGTLSRISRTRTENFWLGVDRSMRNETCKRYFANRIFLLALEFENIFSLLILNNCITINESNMRCYTSLQRNYFMTFKHIERTVYYYYREYKISSLLHAHDIKRY